MQESIPELEKKSYFTEEGQIQGAVGAVIALIVGVGVACLVIIFVGLLAGQAYNVSEDNIQSIGNISATAESLGSATNISGTLNTLSTDHSFVHAGSLSIYNTSAPFTEFGLGNFTITGYDTANRLSISLSATWGGLPGPINNSALSANYSYGNSNIRDHVQNSIISGFSALEDTGSYLPLIVLGIVIFLILTLVLGISALAGGGNSYGRAL